MSLRVLSDTDRQSKLADDQSKLLAQLDGVSKKFTGASHNALEDINLEVFQKDFLSIVGPSGCGKTSLLKMMCGLIKPTSGKIVLELPAATTLSLREGRYVYDVLITKGNVTERVVEGNVLVRAGVTRI